MRSWKIRFALLALGVFPAQLALPQAAFGPSGDEAEPCREQTWLVPSPDPNIAARAVLYRPPGDGPFRLAVVAHASTQNVLRRAQMPQPEYRAIAEQLVVRGFAVLVVERLGHGATRGPYLEDQGGCDEADYLRSGRATADQIALALQFLRGQPFIRKQQVVIIGHSAGGFGALALAGDDPRTVSAIIVFAAGRGGHANDVLGKVCAPHTLIAAAEAFGKGARVPVSWLVAANDSYFPPDFSRQVTEAFPAGGGTVEFWTLPASGSEGHWMVETESGLKLATAELGRALRLGEPKPVGKR
jgi:dienelactone hydrolase